MPPEKRTFDFDEPSADNPIPIALSLNFVGLVARILVKAGVPEFLEERAAASSTKWDDFLARIAANAIRHAAAF